MKLSLATPLLLLLIGAVNALPSDLKKRDDPDLAPITLEYQPGQSKSFTCGKTTYTGHDIYMAAQYGVALQNAGQTRGRSGYPQIFLHEPDEKTPKFPDYCPSNDNGRREYPLKKGDVYNGGKNNQNQGDERVVYYYKDEEDVEGHPKAYYCGIMTHVDAPKTGGFVLC